MQSGSPAVARPMPSTRSRLTNGTGRVHGVDGRSGPARRMRDLVADFTAAIGATDDAATTIRIRRLAELMVTAETLLAKAIAGKRTDLAALVKVENLCSRQMRELGLDKPRKPAVPNLRDYLANRSSSPPAAAR